MILGDPTSLEEPNTLLLSRSIAKKLFGTNWQVAKPIGKTVTIDGEVDYIVQGIFEDIPENSHIKFEVLASFRTLFKNLDWDTAVMRNFRTYLLIEPQTDIRQLEEKLQKISDNSLSDFLKQQQYDLKADITLQPIRDVHLNSFGYQSEPEVRGSNATVQFLFITACFILLLAWINYVNLSTARAVKRAKEVGIRKVVGAGRRQLITQFLLEAFLINLLSIVVAATLYQLAFPYFTGLVQKAIPVSALLEAPWFLTGIFLIIIFGTLLSGGYSAFVLSSFKAVSIAEGKFHTSSQGVLLRKSLIVFQFVISVGLIIGTYSVYQQLAFMKNYEVGYDLSQKLIVRAPRITDGNYHNHYESFKSSVKKIAGVQQVTASYVAPGDAHESGQHDVHEKGQPEKKIFATVNCVDEDYLNTYQVPFLYGRGFSCDFPSDKNAAVISKDLALQLGFDPVETALQGKIVIAPVWWGKEVSVVGIIDDIVMHSLKQEPTGDLFLLANADERHMGYSGSLQFYHFTIDINDISHLQENIASIEKLYKERFPGNPFEYFFLDDYFNAQYRAEGQYGKVFTVASSLAIFIACLGLFGLSAFMIKQRTKEIGIRKVLGAPVPTILLLLSRDYFKLILLAGVIALPIAYFSLHQWLENYTVRIPLAWWLFLVPLAIVVLIALVTVSVQTVKAALANPAKSLRYE